MVKRSDYIETVPQPKERVKDATIRLDESYSASFMIRGGKTASDVWISFHTHGQTLTREGVQQVIDILTDIHKIMED